MSALENSHGPSGARCGECGAAYNLQHPTGFELAALAFARVRPLAAVLLLPYRASVAYAAALTLALWRANAEQLAG